MRSLLTIFLISALLSCSAEWHLQQAIRKGATQKIDTIHQVIQIPIPEVHADTIFKTRFGDTIVIEKDRLKMKYVRLTGDTIFLEGECEADTIYKEVKTPYTVEISAPKGFWYYLPWILVVIAMIVVAGLFSRKR